MRTVRLAGTAAAAAILLAACAPRQAPPLSAAPTPLPARPQPAPEPPPPLPADWRDAPLSPGDWSYRSDGAVSRAAFGLPGGDVFILSCEAGRSIVLARIGPGAQAILVRTTFGERRLPAPLAGARDAVARLAPSDPLLDEMAFSRGRFVVEADGAATLILPTWLEPARVIEDCRGG